MDLYIGSAIHWNTDTDAIEYLERCALAVEDGKITEFTADSSRVADLSADSRSHVLTSTQFLLPGFIDAHVHAPQYPNLGLGVDLPLLTWLRTYIFALERKFSDLSYATTVYDKVVDRLIANGTTTASYFGTIHTDACLLLADTVHRKGNNNNAE
ncbi:guanine deaminase-like, partial [Diaphorina citri]|uniref:Guanine deaminase-like n=1 Tax=Diaphorina citri TaxID=121845 RepID=A0A1S3DQE0_DIACI